MRTKNHFELRGFVGNDPEIKKTENGKTVINLRLATNEAYQKKDSKEKTKTTDWHSVTLWDVKAELVSKYVKKGALISIEGRMKPRSYDKENVTVYTIDLLVDTLDIIVNKDNS